MAFLPARLPLRIAVVQFSPKIGQVLDNIARANELLSPIQPRSVDLVCLPEMVFTGYAFQNSASILPFLEDPRTGPTSKFCAELAKRLECHVVAGYPERLKDDEILPRTDNQVEIVGANSAVLYGPDGEWIGGYRKTNLFETDKPWAKPGTGFATFHLPAPLHTVCLGICMDLNVQPPHDWTLPDGPYELADHCVAQHANLLILLNAWLESQESKSEDEEETADWRTVNMWALRLRPLWVGLEPKNDTAGESRGEESHGQSAEKSTTVVICNRTGKENGMKFAGSSALLRLTAGSGKPVLLNKMNKNEEGIRIWRA